MEEVEYGFGVELRLFHVGDMCGIKGGDFGALDLLGDPASPTHAGGVAGPCVPTITNVGAVIFGLELVKSMSRIASQLAT